jgi:hypothetical protein
LADGNKHHQVECSSNTARRRLSTISCCRWSVYVVWAGPIRYEGDGGDDGVEVLVPRCGRHESRIVASTSEIRRVFSATE